LDNGQRGLLLHLPVEVNKIKHKMPKTQLITLHVNDLPNSAWIVIGSWSMQSGS
jgi:hypothetical protein